MEKNGRFIALDFNDVDINLFIKYISELTGRNFVVDRGVRGKVTIISPTRISESDAYRVFESVLEVNGYTTVESGSIIKIIPSAQARTKSIATLLKDQATYPEDKVVTQIIPLTHASPNDVKKILAPLVSKTSVVIPHTESGVLIITDVLSNIHRLQEIIRAIDVPSIGDDLVIMPLQNASATTVARTLGKLFLRPVKKGGRREIVKIIPYERTNSLIVLASKVNVRKIRNLLVQLDSRVPRGGGKIQVYYLQHANAEELVKVLTNLPDSKTSGKAAGKAPPISRDVKIMADAETNSLIIQAPRDEYLVLEDVIKKLDIPRRMVYMEALIMEVQVSKSFELGVQWSGEASFSSGSGAILSGFSGNQDAPYDALAGINSSPPVLPSGFSFGIMKQGVRIGNMYFPNLSAVVRAYKDDSDINIIATPQILTTDNKKAEIKVGENVPYIVSKNTTDAQQDYTNYEYKDVATSLSITPQINQSDLVRLDIGVEVIKLKNLNDGRPTTYTRSASTTVVVRNEETVVIGGIIGQDTSSGEYKVPLLGDIPILGWLFKTRVESQEKTNLFIFITPHIVENPAELADLYYRKRDIMESVQPGSSDIPDNFFYNKTNPAHAAALADIGFAKLQKKEYGAAKQYLEQALKRDPENISALVNLGVILEHEGKKEQARILYEKALNIPSSSGDGADLEESRKAMIPDPLREMARKNLEQLQ
ncbi:type II secretion system secretin GspD [Desulfolithobacter sp.]